MNQLKNLSKSQQAAIRMFKEASTGLKEVEQVILFGSVARGDFHTDSDIDVLVVLEEGCEGRKIELDMEIAGFSFKILMEIDEYVSAKVFTKEEFTSLKEQHSRFIENVLKEGLVIV